MFLLDVINLEVVMCHAINWFVFVNIPSVKCIIDEGDSCVGTMGAFTVQTEYTKVEPLPWVLKGVDPFTSTLDEWLASVLNRKV